MLQAQDGVSMGLLNHLINDPLAFVLSIIPLLYSVVIHEVAHGWVANRMGDPTAKWMGRLTLNPIKHLDLFGTIMLFLVGFGWAKPVPVNINNIPDRRKGLIFVSSAGIASNILIAVIAVLSFRFFSLNSSEIATKLISSLFQVNITLAALNLIPIPPLDGSKILMGIAPESTRSFLFRVEPYGLIIILGLFYLGILDFLIGFMRAVIITGISFLLP
jgi:Zn-dependent protease